MARAADRTPSWGRRAASTPHARRRHPPPSSPENSSSGAARRPRALGPLHRAMHPTAYAMSLTADCILGRRLLARLWPHYAPSPVTAKPPPARAALPSAARTPARASRTPASRRAQPTAQPRPHLAARRHRTCMHLHPQTRMHAPPRATPHAGSRLCVVHARHHVARVHPAQCPGAPPPPSPLCPPADTSPAVTIACSPPLWLVAPPRHCNLERRMLRAGPSAAAAQQLVGAPPKVRTAGSWYAPQARSAASTEGNWLQPWAAWRAV